MLRNRPAAILCLIFSAGIAAGLFLKYWGAAAAAVLLALFFFTARLYGRRYSALLFASAALFLGCIYAAVFTSAARPPLPEKGKVYTFDAVVRDVAVYESGMRAEIEIQDGFGPFGGRRAYVYTELGRVKPLDVLTVNAAVTESGYKAKSSGVDYMVYGSFEVNEGKKPQGWYYKAAALRRRVGEAVERAFSGEAAGFYRALTTGDRSGVGLETSASFSRSGILHILAVSGLHFSVVIMGLYRLLMATLRRKRLCSLLAMGAAALYSLFTGFSPSVLRAAFMCCAVFAANLFKERTDAFINLTVSLAILLILRPFAVVNTSLLLSFLATAGIILALRQLDVFYERRNTPTAVKWIFTPAVLSLSASLFCMPVYLLCFDFVSICSPVTNIFVGALVGPALVLGIAAAPLNALGIGLASHVGELLFKLIRLISDFFGGFKFSCVSLHTPHIWLLALPFAVPALLLCAVRVKNGLRLLAGCAVSAVVICACCEAAMLSGYKTAPALYVGDSADGCCFLFSDGKRFVLADAGGDGGVAESASMVGCAYLDAYVVTSCDESSYLRLVRTLPYVPAETVYLPEVESDAARQILAFCKKKAVKVRIYDSEKGLDLAGLAVYGRYGGKSGAVLLAADGKRGTVLAICGGERPGPTPAEGCETLVVTRACTEGRFDPDLLPPSCDKAFIYAGDKSFLTGYIGSAGITDDIRPYTGELFLRLGGDGAREVNGNE